MSSSQKTELSQDGAERWRVIVRQALGKGGDIAVLVSQFAQQAFDQRVAELDAQGIRRRILEGAKRIHDREALRASEHLATDGGKQSLLADFYGVRVEVPDTNVLIAQKAQKAGAASTKTDAPLNKRAEDAAHRAHSVPLPEPLTRRDKLTQYVDEHKKKSSLATGEMARLDIILNRGLRNQQAVIDELGGISRELYRIAQEVAQKEKMTFKVSFGEEAKATLEAGTPRSQTRELSRNGGDLGTDSNSPSPPASPELSTETREGGEEEEDEEEEVSALRDLFDRVLSVFQVAFGGLGRRINSVTAGLSQVATPPTLRVSGLIGQLITGAQGAVQKTVQRGLRLIANLLPKSKKRRVKRVLPASKKTSR